jgi:aryl-alcohol dehydrogenase-like predicted oxidoreductase
MGLGTWAIGGPFWRGDRPVGWGQVDDAESIRAYGWSTDHLDRAQVLALCEELDLASINRSPLSKGLLTGKFTADSDRLPADDVRHDWDFQRGEMAERLKTLDTVREVLTSDGRTLTQAALGWLWARSSVTVPIPGFKTVRQVEENAGALRFGPLSPEQMRQIEGLLSP